MRIIVYFILILITISCKRKDNSLRIEVTGELHQPSEGAQEEIKSKSNKLIDSVIGKNKYRKEIYLRTSYGEDNIFYTNSFEIDSIKNKRIEIEYNLDLELQEWDTLYYVGKETN